MILHRSLMLVAGLAGAIAACSQPSYEVARPWAGRGDLRVEAIQLEKVTRPAVRITLTEGRAELPLGSVEPGSVATYVAALSGAAGAFVDLRIATPQGTFNSAAACRVQFDSTQRWQRCEINVDSRATAATLEITGPGPEPTTLAVASPILRSRRAPRRPPVFLLLIDTVRADRLKTWNPQMPIGQAIDALGRDGIVFDCLRSSSSWTRSAVTTILTGLTAERHRVLDRSDVLGSDVPLLPETLQEHGYVTKAWTTNPNILPLWGFARGFDAFVDLGGLQWLNDKVDASVVVKALEEAVEENDDLPVFYYAHFMDAHAPYVAKSEYLQRALAAPALRASFPGEATGPLAAKATDDYPKYLAELMDLDDRLGEFFAFLKSKGWYDKSLILVVADHGEEFLDHGDQYHGKTLYEEMLRVPGVLKLPGQYRAGTHLHNDATLADLMPTLLKAVNAPAPSDLDGIDLLSRRDGARVVRPETATIKLDGRYLSALVEDHNKLVVDHHQGTELLFDLGSDPHERTSLLQARPTVAGELHSLLDSVAAKYEQGWHVRGCAGTNARAVHLETTNSGAAIRTGLFEPDDRIEIDRTTNRTHIVMQLGLQVVTREVFGKLVEDTVRDQDEIVIATDTQHRNLQLRVIGEPIIYTLGSKSEPMQGSEIDISPDSDGVRVRGSQPVECTVERAPPSDPYLRIWYVPPPAQRTESDIDTSVLERLKALGYLQ